MEPMSGIEPPTYGLRNRCSTTELHWLEETELTNTQIQPPDKIRLLAFTERKKLPITAAGKFSADKETAQTTRTAARPRAS